jgi:hypothetical protein
MAVRALAIFDNFCNISQLWLVCLELFFGVSLYRLVEEILNLFNFSSTSLMINPSRQLAATLAIHFQSSKHAN